VNEDISRDSHISNVLVTLGLYFLGVMLFSFALHVPLMPLVGESAALASSGQNKGS
jgi:hypothetical protein